MAKPNLGELTQEETREVLKSCIGLLPLNEVCDVIIEALDETEREELMARLEDADEDGGEEE